jgi:hypothetical protein
VTHPGVRRFEILAGEPRLAHVGDAELRSHVFDRVEVDDREAGRAAGGVADATERLEVDSLERAVDELQHLGHQGPGALERQGGVEVLLAAPELGYPDRVGLGRRAVDDVELATGRILEHRGDTEQDLRERGSRAALRSGLDVASDLGHEPEATGWLGQPPVWMSAPRRLGAPPSRGVYSATVAEPPLTGGCNCGSVRFEVDGPLLAASYCHCRRCQRRTGTAVSANARPVRGAFRIVAGEGRMRVWAPGNGWEKWFCGDCGSAVFSRDPEDSDAVGIRMGAFDGDPGIRPRHHQFVAYAASWEPIPDDGLPRHQERAP